MSEQSQAGAARARPIQVIPSLDLGPEIACEDLRAAVARAMDRLDIPPEAELALVLTDDAQLQQLNRSYRQIDKPTDVLSFPVDPEDLPPGEPLDLGDVIISVPYAQRNALQAGHDLDSELRLLAVHGLLHLLGHEDQSEAGAAEMRRLEIALGVRGKA